MFEGQQLHENVTGADDLNDGTMTRTGTQHIVSVYTGS